MAKPALVTLLSDFGTADPYVAAMKGTILRLCPGAQIVDISHDIAPQDVLGAAFVLARSAPYFPPGTLHVVVVDPTVGTDRRILAGKWGDQTFLFPDNGVITFVAEILPLEAIYTVRNTALLPPARPSMTFHGRDIFAPIAAHLLSGVELRMVGPQPDQYKLLDLAAPRREGGDLIGQVIYVDHFGNLVSNISHEDLLRNGGDMERLIVRCGGQQLGLQGTYGFVAAGEALSLINSMGLVEVAVNCGSAAAKLGVRVGQEVRIEGFPQ